MPSYNPIYDLSNTSSKIKSIRQFFHEVVRCAERYNKAVRDIKLLQDENDLLKEELSLMCEAFDSSGIRNQAMLDEKAPPLRISVEQAKKIWGMVENG